MVKKYTSLTILFLFLIYGCGFKVVDKNASNNFDIVEIETTGDNRINFNLKNRLLYSSKKNLGNPISVNINTEKNKRIKEKNIKNQITKYEIEININVSLIEIKKQKKYEFNILKTSAFNVAEQYSQTLNNEKKLVELMTEEMVDDILEEINNKLNDL